MTRGQCAEHVASCHDRARVDGRYQWFVGGTQAVLVLDRHDTVPRDGACEHHRAAASGQHRLAEGPGEIDAAVARPERVIRRRERCENRERRPQRPGVGATGHTWSGPRRWPGTGRARLCHGGDGLCGG